MRLILAMTLGLFGTSAVAAELSVVVDELLEASAEATRIAVPPATGGDADTRSAVEAQLLRLLLERENEEIITPAYITRVLDEQARGTANAYGPLAADHVLISEIVDAAGERAVELRLVHTETGGVVASGRADWGKTGGSSVTTTSARGAVARMVDELFIAMSQLPGEHRYQRVAVAALEPQGEAAKNARVDRFLRAELSRALAERGFLVVERARLDAAVQQQTLGAMLDEESAPAIGKLVDAQAILVGTVADAGESFEVNVRAVGVETAGVLGATQATLPRAGVVTLASGSIETRTPGEAIFRSALAPGWGQFYNRKPAKGVAFAAFGYGAAATTVTLATVSFLSVSAYDSYAPSAGTPAAQAGLEAKALREQAGGWLTATAVAGIITGSIWGLGVADAAIDGLEAAQ